MTRHSSRDRVGPTHHSTLNPSGCCWRNANKRAKGQLLIPPFFFFLLWGMVPCDSVGFHQPLLHYWWIQYEPIVDSGDVRAKRSVKKVGQQSGNLCKKLSPHECAFITAMSLILRGMKSSSALCWTLSCKYYTLYYTLYQYDWLFDC